MCCFGGHFTWAYVRVHRVFIVPDIRCCVTAWCRTDSDWWQTSVLSCELKCFCKLFKWTSPCSPTQEATDCVQLKASYCTNNSQKTSLIFMLCNNFSTSCVIGPIASSGRVLGMIWEEAVLALLRRYIRRDWEKPREKLVEIAAVLTEIRTRVLRNTRQKCDLDFLFNFISLIHKQA
jgi:hypothetical protein